MNYLSSSYIKEKWQHTGFQKYFRNTGWMFVGRIFSLIISFFVSIYIARELGPEQYGTLNFIISFVSIAGFTLFAIDSLLIKKLNQEPENTNSILGSALLIKIINSIFTILTATILALFFANTNTTIFLILFYSTFTIFQSFSIIDFYFQAHAQNKSIALMNLILVFLSSIIKILIIYLHFPFLYIFLSYVIDHIMNAIGYTYLYHKNIGPIFKWTIQKNIFYHLIKKSWPFTLSAIATSIYIRIDQIFLKLWLGSESVGLYVVAVRFSEVWFFISSIICVSLLPAILNAQKTSNILFFERSKKLYSLLFYTSILICILVFITAPLIISTFYGDIYRPSIFLLRIYIWSIIGVFVSTALQQFLLAQNKFKTILILNVLGMITSLVLNYIFIPIWGTVGAAISNICAYTIPFIFILASKNMREQRKAFILAIFKPFS